MYKNLKVKIWDRFFQQYVKELSWGGRKIREGEKREGRRKRGKKRRKDGGRQKGSRMRSNRRGEREGRNRKN